MPSARPMHTRAPTSSHSDEDAGGVRAVKADHATTAPSSSGMPPNLAASQPPGICTTAYP